MALVLYKGNSEDFTPKSSRKSNRWIFEKGEVDNPPSIYHPTKPITLRQERGLRKWCSSYIMYLSKRFYVPGQIVCTAIVYMQRFFMVKCFQDFDRKVFCSVCLYVACKFEGMSRPFTYFVRQAYKTEKENGAFGPSGFIDRLQYEDILLKTLNCELQIQHPSSIVSELCQKLGTSKDFTFMAHSLCKSSLMFTVMCLMYKPEVIACVCLHQTSIWTHRHIPLNDADGQPWYAGFEDITPGQLNLIATDFVYTLNSSSPIIKEYILSRFGKLRTNARVNIL